MKYGCGLYTRERERERERETERERERERDREREIERVKHIKYICIYLSVAGIIVYKRIHMHKFLPICLNVYTF